MKILVIICGILLAGFIGIQLFALKSQHNIEIYPYKVVEQYDSFEIRRYEARLFSAVKISSGDYKSASGQGFSVLARYIFGGNDRNEKIAMTSPVAMTIGDSMTMRFMIPKKWNKAQLPKPNQNNINFVEEPEKLVAAIQFKGWASDKKIKRYKKLLKTALKSESIPHLNKFELYGYNAPYEVFNRRNEIIVELEQKF
jgi:hypothetical protein